MKIFSKICWKPEAVFVRPTVVLVSGLERSRECTEFSGEKILSARLETSARGVRSEVRQLSERGEEIDLPWSQLWSPVGLIVLHKFCLLELELELELEPASQPGSTERVES